MLSARADGDPRARSGQASCGSLSVSFDRRENSRLAVVSHPLPHARIQPVVQGCAAGGDVRTRRRSGVRTTQGTHPGLELVGAHGRILHRRFGRHADVRAEAARHAHAAQP